MKNYFIIHGSFGNSQENWFPWLEKQIIGGGISASTSTFQ